LDGFADGIELCSELALAQNDAGYQAERDGPQDGIGRYEITHDSS
jgi:hypothetical protein